MIISLTMQGNRTPLDTQNQLSRTSPKSPRRGCFSFAVQLSYCLAGTIFIIFEADFLSTARSIDRKSALTTSNDNSIPLTGARWEEGGIFLPLFQCSFYVCAFLHEQHFKFSALRFINGQKARFGIAFIIEIDFPGNPVITERA